MSTESEGSLDRAWTWEQEILVNQLKSVKQTSYQNNGHPSYKKGFVYCTEGNHWLLRTQTIKKLGGSFCPVHGKLVRVHPNKNHRYVWNEKPKSINKKMCVCVLGDSTI